MNSDKITIRMPKKLLAAWLEALRSGKYEQGSGRLFHPDTKAYCCLGVLQAAAGGPVESGGLPSLPWLTDHQVQFFNAWEAPAETNAPHLPTLGMTAYAANDLGRSGTPYTFPEIADAIEACAEGF